MKKYLFYIFREIYKNKKFLYINSTKKFNFEHDKYNFLIIPCEKKIIILKVIFFLIKNKVEFKKNFFLIYKKKNFLQGKYLFTSLEENNKSLFFFLRNIKHLKYMVIALKNET